MATESNLDAVCYVDNPVSYRWFINMKTSRY